MRTSSACSSFKPHEKDPFLINASQKQNFKLKLLVTLPNNTEVLAKESVRLKAYYF